MGAHPALSALGALGVVALVAAAGLALDGVTRSFTANGIQHD